MVLLLFKIKINFKSIGKKIKASFNIENKKIYVFRKNVKLQGGVVLNVPKHFF